MERQKSLPVILGVWKREALVEGVMKNTKHLLLGLVASLLLAAGFARAADRVDLSIQALSPEISKTTPLSIKPCSAPCGDPPPDGP